MPGVRLEVPGKGQDYRYLVSVGEKVNFKAEMGDVFLAVQRGYISVPGLILLMFDARG